MHRSHIVLSALIALALCGIGCGTADAGRSPSTTPSATSDEPNDSSHVGHAPPSTPRQDEVVDARPPPMHQPVPLYENGAIARQIDAGGARADRFVVVDLGEAWTPYLFTERGSPEEPIVQNDYREIYLALARGEFPDNHHGDRARDDQFLEPFGIPPTLGLLRTRFTHSSGLACARALEVSALNEFTGQLSYESRDAGRTFARQYHTLDHMVRGWMADQGVTDPAAVDGARLPDRDQRRLADYFRIAPRFAVIREVQARLECEGYFEGFGEHVDGGFDWPTHEALATFERRHRIYGWGIIGRDTLDMLRRTPLEGEQEAVVRVLTERVMHAAGVIEDGSVHSTFRGSDGQTHDVPNLEGQIRAQVIEAFGLGTPESTRAFLESLGDLPVGAEHLVALHAPDLPEYYAADMDFHVEIDRGDVWYDFPYGAHGEELMQPVERRPHTTIMVRWNGQDIRLATYGTTIGGWRSELIDGQTYWRYKDSPPGPVVWHQIVAAPVWLPPESTPVRDLLERSGARGSHGWAPDYHEVGPSYASAYGLVAAYHIRYFERTDGTVRLGGDEGIRSHGSVDYTSIMRRHSHGCHRLLNHIAVRLMSYVLAHRRHERVGIQGLGFRRELERDGNTWTMAIDRGGYVFSLERPVHVEVLEGRIRGELQHPVTAALPRYDTTRGAYVQITEGIAEGVPVTVSRLGVVTPIPGGWPAIEAARMALDGGVPQAQ